MRTAVDLDVPHERYLTPRHIPSPDDGLLL